MNKLLKYIGLLCLTIFTFFYTDKTASVLINQDELMIKIKEEQYKYEVSKLESIIKDDTIIPGIKGKKVDINKSYNNMKEIGIYNSNYLIYEDVLPKETLDNNKDKYIIKGNKEKRMVTLLFVLDEKDDIYTIIKELKQANIKANLFVNINFFYDNSEILSFLINNGYNINYYGNYNSSEFIWSNSILNKLNQNKNYCYLENKNKDFLNICKLNKYYTVIPNIVIKKDLLINVKKNIENGSLISIDVNDSINELSLVINYIKSKGFNIGNLDEHLSH